MIGGEVGGRGPRPGPTVAAPDRRPRRIPRDHQAVHLRRRIARPRALPLMQMIRNKKKHS